MKKNITLLCRITFIYDSLWPGKPGGKILYEVNITVNGKKKELELDANGVIVK